MVLEKELKDLRKQNLEQFLIILKEYIIIYFKTIYFFKDSKLERRMLIDNLINYLKIIKEENKYFSLILENLDKIADYNEIDKILDELDVTNSFTYDYYDSIISEYETAISLGDKKRANVPKKNFKFIINSSKYREEIIGLLLNKEDVINYFSKYSEILYWLNSRTKIINCDTQDGMIYYGLFPKMNENILIDFNICVPQIINLQTMLINIHEYKHAIDLFAYLGKELPPKDYERLAKQEEMNFMKTYIKDKQQKYFK